MYMYTYIPIPDLLPARGWSLRLGTRLRSFLRVSLKTGSGLGTRLVSRGYNPYKLLIASVIELLIQQKKKKEKELGVLHQPLRPARPFSARRGCSGPDEAKRGQNSVTRL